MTRNDYAIIAEGFAQSRPSLEDHTTTSYIGDNTFINHITYEQAVKTWERVRRDVAFLLQVDNPRFDGAKFKEATEA